MNTKFLYIFIAISFVSNIPLFSFNNFTITPQEETYYTVIGTVFKKKNKKPIEGATVSIYKTIKDKESKRVQYTLEKQEHSILTGTKGEFRFDLNSEEDYLLIVSKEGYQLREAILRKQKISNGAKVSIEIPLVAGESQIMQGAVVNASSNSPLGGTIITLKRKDKDVTFQTITQGDGSFQLHLEKGVSYHLEGSKSQFFTSKKDFVAFDFQGKGIYPLVLELKEMETGDVITLDIFFFSINSTEVNDTGKKALSKIITLLIDNPSIAVEVACHSDARGDDQYNLTLSQNRADAIAKYLNEQGVALHQISAKGYGEEKLLNECSNGVRCNNEKHLENRRIELRILDIIE